MKKKSIAIVADAVYPFNKGGKEKRIYDITTRLVAEGHNVTIYCMNWWKEGGVIVKDGVTFHAISPYYPLYTEGGRRSIKEAILFSLHCLKLVTKSFDVIEVDHMPHLVLFTVKIVCLLRRKRMIVTWHEVWGKKSWKKYLGTMGTLASWVERTSAKLPDVIISVSEHTTKALRKTLYVKQEIITATAGVDSKVIESISPAKQKSDIIFAGRLLSHKNVDILLHALAIVKKTRPGISLVIAGEGPEQKKLEALAKKLHLQKNISFLGFIENHHDLYALMQSSKVFVLPSTREGFGIAALEANACGLPVITIDHKHNAAKDLIVEGENGSITELDENLLAQAIERSFGENKDRNIYRKYARKYEWKHIVTNIQKVYAQSIRV